MCLAFKKNILKLEINLKAFEKKKLHYQMNLLDLMKINLKPNVQCESQHSFLNSNNNNNCVLNDSDYCFLQADNLAEDFAKNFARPVLKQDLDSDCENLALHIILKTVKMKTRQYFMVVLAQVLHFILPPIRPTKIEKIKYIKK